MYPYPKTASPPPRRRRTQRLVNAVVVVATSLFGVAGLVSVAQPAGAVTTSNQQTVPVASGQLDLGGFLVPGPIPVPDLPVVFTDLTFTANATWTGDITTDVAWDSDNVRQGDNLDISRNDPLTSGKIDVAWQMSGKADGIDFGPINFSQNNVTCAPALAGGTRTCTGKSDEIILPGALPSPVPASLIEAKLGIGVQFDVTPEGAVADRTFSVGGTNIPGPTANPGPLDLVTAPSTETFTMPCTAAVGDAVNYNLSDYHWTPDTTATQQVKIRIVNTVPFDPNLNDESFEYTHIDVGPAQTSSPAFDLAGSGFLTSLGPLLANNVVPTIEPLGPFSGTEGSPVNFSTVTHSQCPINSYVWQFSDGTTSYGPSPQRAFGQDGVYSGQLTVTDVTGLSSTQSFTVDITNAPPLPNAGPDTSGAWGRPIAFNGQAVDPGWGDQATLSYAWDWGDGTPGTGGANAFHAYATPGLYTATLTVCDDHVCRDDTAAVTVRRRVTTTAYSGPLSALPSKNVTLTASVIDEFGQPVVGRTVAFQLGTQSITAATNGSGVASATIKLNQKKATISVSASFAGDSKYTSSSDTRTFTIG
jgi:PKD repeat protein